MFIVRDMLITLLVFVCVWFCVCVCVLFCFFLRGWGGCGGEGVFLSFLFFFSISQLVTDIGFLTSDHVVSLRQRHYDCVSFEQDKREDRPGHAKI